MNIDVKGLFGGLIGKCVSVGATVFISNGGIDAFMAWFNAVLTYTPTTDSVLLLKGVSLIAAYSIWTKVIVPFVSGLLQGKTTAGKAKNEWAEYLTL